MLPILIVFGALVASVSAFCGTPTAYNERGSFNSALKITEQLRGPQGETPPRTETTYLIDVYMHVIHSPIARTSVDDLAVSTQMDVLNKGFADAGFSFHLVNVSNTVKAEWFDMEQDSPEDYKMHRSVAQGNYADLNIFIHKIRGSLAGYATFPSLPDHVDDDVFIMDGITLEADVLPGGADKPYSTGKIAVHEVGHWLGLLHTFEEGCTGTGDEIYDTPAQQYSSVNECPVKKNTCGESNPSSKPGDDPVHNHMDYSTDVCRTQFTLQQIARMRSAWELARAPWQ